MSGQYTRYEAGAFRLAEGWSLERLTQPSRLFGANGLRTVNGRIYVAQVAGSQISAVDVDTGAVEAVSPMGAGIVGPDDLALDPEGNIYATEITEGRVSVRRPNGETRVLRGDMPVANPITYYNGHLIAGECRPGGRIMELDLHGGAPRMILENVPAPNAFDVGPDGKLYFPVMGANEIWRVDLKGGAPEVIAKDLGLPDSVKFDSKGRIVSTQVASGQVLRIDPRTGNREVLADIAPGLDNCTFVGDRIFVSRISGQISEVLGNGATRSLVPDGLQWPLGLAVGEDGLLFVADGGCTYTLRPGEKLDRIGVLFAPGFPGYIRGVAVAGPGSYLVTTANGDVAHWWPAEQRNQNLANGLDQPFGVATASGGAIIVAERGKGRVVSIRSGKVEELATGLHDPRGVAVGADGVCLVSDTGAGRIVKLGGGRAEIVLDGLQMPHGIAIRGDRLFIVDTGSKEVIEYGLDSKVRRTIATHLPVGSPPGVKPNELSPFLPLCGAMSPFAGIAAGKDGTLYVSADAEGSVLAIRPE